MEMKILTEVKENRIFELLLQDLSGYSKEQVKAVLDLLNDGNTVPFIARYRKEATGSLDEVQIREIEERNTYITNLEKRKEEVLSSIEEQNKLTDELEQDIRSASQLQRVEDLYRPYKQKRRTKATIAKERGLEPFAQWLRTFPAESVNEEAKKYIDEDQELKSVQDVLDGAHEIIAEYISDNADYRKRLRDYTIYNATIEARVKNEKADEKGIYEMYYDYTENYRSTAPHRVLAMNRGENEDILKVDLVVDEDRAHRYLFKQEIPQENSSEAIGIVKEAIQDSYKRFIKPAIERELRSDLTEKAENHAIEIFGENLRNLLLQAPLKDQIILGFDPAFRSGCKLAVVDQTGKVLDILVIYPHASSDQQREKAKQQLIELVEKHAVDTIAIGNGTASRESEQFVAETLKETDKKTAYIIVNEAGASVYSASAEARREFPDLQVEERSAVSIARRLQDPLAELVKIDPQSIGVGQYQHDVSQKELTTQLDFVVETAVNQVGINVNTASPTLLKHISGLTKTTAENVVLYREENGKFTNRSQLKKVKRLGPKAYEQSVGFLRIPDGKEPFDQTGIHPETYEEAEQILHSVGLSKNELGTEEVKTNIAALDDEQVLDETGLGKETYKDIREALTSPGRDMRDDMPAPLLRTDVLQLKDLREGMKLEGTVRNVVDFGAFVDIGVKQDGLVHISKMSDKFVEHPKDIVAVGDIITVWISSVDVEKERIGLSMLGELNK